MQSRKLSIIFIGIILSNCFIFARDPKRITEVADTIKSIYLPPLRKVAADSIINYGKLFLDTPYRYGGNGTSSFDCSGFTSHVFRNFGYNLNRSSAQQAEQFPTVVKTEIKPGDLVFFNGRSRNGRVGHVGIVVETHQDGDFDFIHASVSSGVVVSNSNENYYQRRYVKAARVLLVDSLLQLANTNSIPVKRDEYVSVTPAQKIKKTIPAVYHSVKSGENLTTIAKKYGLSVSELKNLNNLTKSTIKAKQSLMIKEAEQISVMVPMMAQSAVGISKDSVNKIEKNAIAENKVTTPAKHLVKKGETLFSIAKMYKADIELLKKLNKLSNSKIIPGNELILPPETNTLLAENDVKNNVGTVDKNSDKKVKVETEAQKLVIEHRVNKGENLGSIAKQYNLSIEQLKSFNKMSNNKLMAGQVLKIESEQLAEAGPSSNTILQHQKEFKELTSHKVSNGESLYSISKKYKVKVDALIEYNQLSNTNIQKGQNIRIPKI